MAARSSPKEGHRERVRVVLSVIWVVLTGFPPLLASPAWTRENFKIIGMSLAPFGKEVVRKR
ncbi:MAG TPA: hypothetical protein VHT75_11515 [Acidimicrobiales bacterium]|nr:hypothetical protein [Acidimicrobiales bacterium]